MYRSYFTNSIAVLVFSLSVSCWAADETPESKDLALLAGEWQLQSLEVDGAEKTPDEQQAKPLTIEGNKMTQDVIKVAFTIDPTTDPKIIDLEIRGANNEAADGVKFEAIYQVDKENLVICLNTDISARVRPVKFETQDGNKLVVVRYKRLN